MDQADLMQNQICWKLGLRRLYLVTSPDISICPGMYLYGSELSVHSFPWTDQHKMALDIFDSSSVCVCEHSGSYSAYGPGQVTWMNHILTTLWPHYNQAIGKMVLESAKPQIEDITRQVRGLKAQLILIYPYEIYLWHTELPIATTECISECMALI